MNNEEKFKEIVGLFYKRSNDEALGLLEKFNLVDSFPTYLTKASSKGDIEAMTVLGMALNYGVLGIDRDPIAASNCFGKASEAGSALAMLNLGIQYRDGNGVPQDLDKAVAWQKKAYAAGETRSAGELGHLYGINGWKGHDLEQSFLWFLKSAESGDAEYISRVAYCFAEGIGTKQNHSKAIDWLKKGIELAAPSACNDLGTAYLQGKWGVRQDRDLAFELYQKGVRSEDANSYYNLGYMYQHGLVSEECKKHDTYIQVVNMLGTKFGIGRDRDFNITVHYYEKAANLGHEWAKEILRGS